jgi:hypothetical protein
MPATEFGGVAYSSAFAITATVNPANHTAVSAVDTTVADANVKAGDQVVAIPPATLEAGIAVQGCHTVVDGSFKLRTTNGSAGAIDPASATWTFLIYRR